MAKPVRYDQQYCPIARGLDFLGDRWTLLIVREVATGPQRFSDLQRNLPGIAATVLTDRLRSMTNDGLVVVHTDSVSPRRTRYSIGPEGRRALPVLAALVQFGMPMLETPDDDTVVRPVMGLRAGILAYFDPGAATHLGTRELYEIHLGDDVFTVNARAEQVATVDSPDLVVRIPDARTLVDIRQGHVTFGRLVQRGAITCQGSADVLDHFRRIYRLGPAPGARRKNPVGS